jgi:hypothetical protein
MLLLAILGAASGCAGTRPTPPPTVLDTSGTDLVAADALPFWLGPQGLVEVWMKITDGKETGKSWHVVPTNITRRESDAGAALDAFTLEWTLEGEATPRSVREMRLEPDGDLVMARVFQHDRNVITVFDPPILVMPAHINPGAVVRQDSKVVVYELKNPKKIKEKGGATLEARFEGEAASPSPSEPRAQARGQNPPSASMPSTPPRTRLYTTNLTLNLSAAKSERFTSRRFDLPPPQGTGTLLEESYEEKIRVLGVTIESTRQTMTLAGTADPTCVPPPAAP